MKQPSSSGWIDPFENNLPGILDHPGISMDEVSPRQVTISDSYWTPRLEVNSSWAIFHQWEQLEARHIDNLYIAGRKLDGFHEGWGQFNGNEVACWLKQVDPTRPVDHASGWFDQGGGDCESRPQYIPRL